MLFEDCRIPLDGHFVTIVSLVLTVGYLGHFGVIHHTAPVRTGCNAANPARHAITDCLRRT